jgi:hypothetical protein
MSKQSIATMLSVHLERVLLAAALVCTAVLLVILTDFGHGRDQGIYSVVGRTILEGGAPYQDAWDFKPPMIYFIYSVARLLFGEEMQAIRMLEALGFASMVVAFIIFSKRHVGSARPGIIGGLVAVSTHVQLEFWSTGQPESFGAIATAWALVAATYTPASGSARPGQRLWFAWFASAALYTFAALCKPPLGGGFLVSLGFVLSTQYRSQGQPPGRHAHRLRALLSPLSAFVAGGVLVMGATVLFFVARDAWEALVSTLFVFAPEYTALSFEPDEFGSFIYKALRGCVFQYSAYILLGLGLLLGLPRLKDREASGAAHIAWVCAFHLVGIALQGKFFAYHYGATLPLLGLLAGWGLWKLWLRVRGRVVVAALSVAALLFFLHDVHPAKPSRGGMTFWQRSQFRLGLIETPYRSQILDRMHSFGDVNPTANRAVAEWLKEHTGKAQSVFIWGFEPMIYDMANRKSASRYIYNAPQRLDWPGQREARAQLMADLRANKPAAIVVASNDIFAVVTGNKRDSEQELMAFSGLKSMLKKRYLKAASFEDFDIYARRPQSKKAARAKKRRK